MIIWEYISLKFYNVPKSKPLYKEINIVIKSIKRYRKFHYICIVLNYGHYLFTVRIAVWFKTTVW